MLKSLKKIMFITSLKFVVVDVVVVVVVCCLHSGLLLDAEDQDESSDDGEGTKSYLPAACFIWK